MILKDGRKVFKKESQKFKKFLVIYFFSTALIASVFVIFFFTSYTVKLKTQKVLDHLSKAGRFEYIYIFNIAYGAFKSNFYKLDKIDLDIKFEDVVILENERDKAIKEGSLGLKDRLTRVNAILKFKDKEIKSRIRLKGDRKMHFVKKKHSSYNIYLSKDKFIYGANSFSIHKPGARNYIHEWIFIEMMGDLGLIKPRYEFFNLGINGSDNGLYVFEEKMGKEILERNKRRNGPILGVHTEFNRSTQNPIFQIYDKQFWNRPENIDLAKIAIKKFSEFLKGQRATKDTFDLDKFGAFFAVIDLTYTSHAMFPNSKFYYNPISGLFEPIPRDGHRMLPNYNKFNMNYYDRILIDSIYKAESAEIQGGNLQITEDRQWWIKKFFTNQDGKLNHNFYKIYLKYLTKISSDDYLEKFFNNRKKEISKINSHIYSDYFYYASTREYGPGLYYFKKSDLFHRANVVRERLLTKDKIISAIIDNNGNLVIDIAYPYFSKGENLIRLDDLKVSYIICDSLKDKNKIIDKQINVISKNSIIKIDLDNIDLNKCKTVRIIDEKLDKIHLVKINRLNSIYDFNEFKVNKDNTFLKFFNKIDNNLYLADNKVTVDEDLFIPSGMNIVIKPNQKLYLINSSFIMSKSPWFADGSNGEIIISGFANNNGGGLMISNTDKESYFNNVKFSNLNGYHSNKEFIIHGGINFYKTKVFLKNITFEKMFSEDAINIVNSNFNIEYVNFIDTKHDSIDFDFSNGNLNHAKFINTDNDAIDFSGSNADITNLYFEKIGDKSISVGENSIINISNVKAFQSYVGIASKDGSTVNAKKIYMTDVKLPFISFNKKNEYKPAKMYLSEVDLNEFHEKWVTDKNSKIYFEKSKVGTISKKLIPIVYEKKIQLLN